MCKTARFIFLAAAFLGASGFLMADIPNDVFQLDGNSETSSTCGTHPVGADDWDLLNGDGTGGPPPGCAGNSLARSFISEPKGVNVFSTGGSKDPNPISQWKWKQGATPDKDTITNGYAAAYQSAGGHLMLLFGGDRFAQNGDANIGLWFFQDNVAPVGNGGGSFSGAHQDNDILIVSAFTGGGGVSTISVYLWDHTCTHGVNNPAPGQCADNNLKLKFASIPSSTCAGVDEGCAIVNSAPISVKWPYLAKFGIGDKTIPAGGFYEGGIDVTEILGTTSLPCFTSFLLDTRTSQTPSSTLKDFVSGNFNICGLNITKSCDGSGVLNPGQGTLKYGYIGLITNIGIGSLDHVSVIDSPPSGATNVAFHKSATAPAGTDPATLTASTLVTTTSCPSGAPAGAVCADLGTIAGGGTFLKWTVSFDVTALNATNNAIAAGAFSGGSLGNCGDAGTVCSTSSGDSCSGSVSNGVSITKACGIAIGYPNNVSGLTAIPGTQLVVSGGEVAVKANFFGDVCNEGDTTLTGVSVTDVPTATIALSWPGTAGTLAPKGSADACAKYSGTYKPGSISSGDGTTAGRYGFSDEVYVTGATASLGDSPAVNTTCTGMSGAPAGSQACNGTTCHICFGNDGTPGLCNAAF